MKNSVRFLLIAVIALLPGSYMASASPADDANSYFSSAEAKFKKGDNQGAMGDYTKAISLDPKHC